MSYSCPVDSRLINAEFVSYNDRSPPPSRLPSSLPDVTHVTLSAGPSLSVFAYGMRSKTRGGNEAGNLPVVVGNVCEHHIIALNSAANL